MNKSGILIEIPEFGTQEIHTIVSDYTGTCQSEAAGKSQNLCCLVTNTVSRKLGGVLEASLRWP
jgi:hypothetical protein